jgi:uncharacterized protein (DUF1501 family)
MYDPSACRDFNRAELLRRGVARAGKGLPSIEPGMPDPAGTGLDRRSFLLKSAGLALGVYGLGRLHLEALEAGVAQAAGGPAQPVIVSVFLPGGLDSLTVLAPTGDPLYTTMRPTLAVKESDGGTPFSEDPRLTWHPAASGLAELHAEGKVTVMPAIGYDHPDQSHFTSRHFWQVGSLDAGENRGWLGRYLDVAGAADNPLQGIALDATLAPVLATSRVPVSAVASPADFTFATPYIDGAAKAALFDSWSAMQSLPSTSAAGAQLRAVLGEVASVRQSLAPFGNGSGSPTYTSPVQYPTAGGDFPQRLAGLAAMLAAGLPIRAVALQGVGSYDTHASQAAVLVPNLQQTVDALVAFQRDIEARGLADRVMVHVWSEFGRRVRENGSGTDHGAGGCSFLIGTRASGQMVGEFPGLATLDPQSNLRATSDYRGVYCSLLEQWLGVDAAQIIPGAASFARPMLVR